MRPLYHSNEFHQGVSINPIYRNHDYILDPKKCCALGMEYFRKQSNSASNSASAVRKKKPQFTALLSEYSWLLPCKWWRFKFLKNCNSSHNVFLWQLWDKLFHSFTLFSLSFMSKLRMSKSCFFPCFLSLYPTALFYSLLEKQVEVKEEVKPTENKTLKEFSVKWKF